MSKYKKNAQKAVKPQVQKSSNTVTTAQSVNVHHCNVLNASQARAGFALKQVKKYKTDLDDKNLKEFKSYVQALPAMVQINGLGQAIAFCRSHYTATDTNKKGAKAYKALYDIINIWLCDSDFAVYSQGCDLLEAIIGNDMHKYRLAQAELQHLLTWLKKMTLALVDIPEDEKSPDKGV